LRRRIKTLTGFLAFNGPLATGKLPWITNTRQGRLSGAIALTGRAYQSQTDKNDMPGPVGEAATRTRRAKQPFSVGLAAGGLIFAYAKMSALPHRRL